MKNNYFKKLNKKFKKKNYYNNKQIKNYKMKN